MLAAEGGNPEVVGGDGFACALECENDFGIVMRGRFVDVQHEAIVDQACEPVFVGGAAARLGDSVAVFAEHNDGNRHLFGASENGNDGGIVIGRSG